jgi:hypothetical protein
MLKNPKQASPGGEALVAIGRCSRSRRAGLGLRRASELCAIGAELQATAIVYGGAGAPLRSTGRRAEIGRGRRPGVLLADF